MPKRTRNLVLLLWAANCVRLVARNVRAARSLADLHRLPITEVSCDWIDLIPVANCPGQAERSARWHIANKTSCIFATASLDTSRTAAVLASAGVPLVRSPGTPNKASQLNFAAAALPSTWLSIYDVDSRPTGTGLAYFVKSDVEPSVIVRPSRYHSESRSLSTRLVAGGQNVWTLVYEVPTWHRGGTYYLVGHGLSLRPCLLEQLPLSTTAVAEDLELGYRASSDGHEVALSPYTDRCTVPPSPAQLVTQAGRWLYGDLQACKGIASRPRRVLRRMEILADWVVDPLIALVAGVVAPPTIASTLAEALWSARIAQSAPWPNDETLMTLAAGRMYRSGLFAIASGVELLRLIREGRRPHGFTTTGY